MPMQYIGGGASRPPSQQHFTLNIFARNATNEFAYDTALRVISGENNFTPIILCGHECGRTHLLNAIAFGIESQRPEVSVTYMDARGFLNLEGYVNANDVISAIQSAEILLVDDLDVLESRGFRHQAARLIAQRIEQGNSVVATMRYVPSSSDELDSRLIELLRSGLICDIKDIDFSLRSGILALWLKWLAIRENLGELHMSGSVLEYLAADATLSVLEIKGVLNTLVSRYARSVQDLTEIEVRAHVSFHLQNNRKVSVDSIQKAVADHYKLKQNDLVSEQRIRVIARPRQVAMWLCKHLTKRSLPDIGRRFGGRDHTTVLHAVRRIDFLRTEEPTIQRDIDIIRRGLLH